MTFWFREHHYSTTPIFYLDKLVFEKPYFRRTMSLFTHMDDCCDYWIPINDLKAERAFMLDDEFSLSNNERTKE